MRREFPWEAAAEVSNSRPKGVSCDEAQAETTRARTTDAQRRKEMVAPHFSGVTSKPYFHNGSRIRPCQVPAVSDSVENG